MKKSLPDSSPPELKKGVAWTCLGEINTPETLELQARHVSRFAHAH
jgi:hypothetical protein